MDPIEIAIAIHAHPKFLWRHLCEAIEGDQESIQIVADTACDVFDISPLAVNGSGLTISERLDLMVAFDAYLLSLKKSIAATPILAAPMESTSKPSDSEAMNDTPGSGSIEDVHSIGQQTSSELES